MKLPIQRHTTLEKVPLPPLLCFHFSMAPLKFLKLDSKQKHKLQLLHHQLSKQKHKLQQIQFCLWFNLFRVLRPEHANRGSPWLKIPWWSVFSLGVLILGYESRFSLPRFPVQIRAPLTPLGYVAGTGSPQICTIQQRTLRYRQTWMHHM